MKIIVICPVTLAWSVYYNKKLYLSVGLILSKIVNKIYKNVYGKYRLYNTSVDDEDDTIFGGVEYIY